MRIIAWSNLAAYDEEHSAAASALKHWARVVYAAEWATMAPATDGFSKAKSVSGDRIRFDIGGGAYRLIVAFNFKRQIAFVKFIGAHAEYDRVDAATVEMF
jgi:mRNA interferase HigB